MDFFGEKVLVNIGAIAFLIFAFKVSFVVAICQNMV